MKIQEAYDKWAGQYDASKNRTRDLEAHALKKELANIAFQNCLEIGCGTGKNTEWLIKKGKHVTAVDFSTEMLTRAKNKIISDKVCFRQADITEEWFFAEKPFDLVTFSLVLEHIKDLDNVLQKASRATSPGGHLYIGELHPYKQYLGTKARFETEEGRVELTCFNHHISDFTQSAQGYGFSVVDINEYFDGDDRGEAPRILTILLRKDSAK
ncbi:class I SAM-dependent methyltransferase [Negadavirga shengliensis]|uniref:Class I SAM-dependent methyltransferase n=1 Tax=Negadavirga shengliensis TaxID=1389218 RepID=A0ABV9SV32_9BACT